ncbi:thiol reductant ABC exporter subunit CydC [Herbiconiux sp. VKM Ac-1786]|uniref:thiol reductant ABC exporter subunit CydC n=1 Tax=Herbiconiux sp. VKM Ac-1786 TaxID=2783824 RepID=UPI00188CD45B|nr:thiol reductant ABC exporter subunit CydC [Herbiconiux sp. VKM Ac-1786]
MNRREVLRLAQPPLLRFAPGVALGLLSALCAVGLLGVSAWLITRAAEQPPILFLSAAMVGVRAFALGRATFRYLERLVGHDAAFATMPALRVGVYERLVPVAPDGLGSARSGDLLSRLVSDVDEQQNLPLRVVQPLVVSGLTSAAVVVVVWLLLPAAGLVLLLSLIAALLVGTVLNAALSGRAERSLAGLRGRHRAALADYLTNLDVLVAYGDDRAALARLDEADAALTAASRRRAVGAGATAAAVTFFAGLATVLTLVVGVPALGAGAVSGSGGFDGPALAVVALVPLAAFEVFAMIPLAAGAWRQVRASADRIASVVPSGVPASIPVDGPSAVRPAPAVFTSLSLREVTAKWPGASSPALAPVSLDLVPGDRVLVRGASGAGKTTLAHVLVRFLEYGGSYRLNGHEAREYPVDAVRRVVGLCEQRPHLFDDDIRQNLLFARDTATDDELLAVLDRVGLGSWVQARGGLTARVGERGALVSGGQAQRLALARALLAGFPVLVLDEPTANVDPEQADALLTDLLAAAAGESRAVLLVSHTPVPSALVTRTLTLSPPVDSARPVL